MKTKRVLDPRTGPALLLHGRQMPRLLHHHNRLLARPDRRYLRRVLNRAVPADGWEGEVDRGVLVQAEVDYAMEVRRRG